MQLLQLKEALEAEDIEVSLETSTGETDLDHLLVSLPTESDEAFVLQVMFVPGLEEELEEFTLLQFFSMLPCEPQKGTFPEIQKLILRLNINLPLPSFGFHQEDGFLYFKYVAPVSKTVHNESPKIMAEAIWLIAYQLNLFYPTIQMVATGQTTVEEVMAG